MAMFRREQQKKWALQFEILSVLQFEITVVLFLQFLVSSCEGVRTILLYFFINAHIDKMEIAHAKA